MQPSSQPVGAHGPKVLAIRFIDYVATCDVKSNHGGRPEQASEVYASLWCACLECNNTQY